MLIVVDWFEYSNSLLFNSSPVTELQETSSKKTPKLSCQVTRETAEQALKHPPTTVTVAHNVKMSAGLVYCTFSDLFRAFCWRTVEFAVLYSFIHQSSVLYLEALVFNQRINVCGRSIIAIIAINFGLIHCGIAFNG